MRAPHTFRGSIVAVLFMSIGLALGVATDAGAAPVKNTVSRGQAVENLRELCTMGSGGTFGSVEGTGANAGTTFTWCDSADGTTACKVSSKTVECAASAAIRPAFPGQIVTIPTPATKGG